MLLKGSALACAIWRATTCGTCDGVDSTVGPKARSCAPPITTCNVVTQPCVSRRYDLLLPKHHWKGRHLAAGELTFARQWGPQHIYLAAQPAAHHIVCTQGTPLCILEPPQLPRTGLPASGSTILLAQPLSDCCSLRPPLPHFAALPLPQCRTHFSRKMHTPPVSTTSDILPTFTTILVHCCHHREMASPCYRALFVSHNLTARPCACVAFILLSWPLSSPGHTRLLQQHSGAAPATGPGHKKIAAWPLCLVDEQCQSGRSPHATILEPVPVPVGISCSRCDRTSLRWHAVLNHRQPQRPKATACLAVQNTR